MSGNPNVDPAFVNAAAHADDPLVDMIRWSYSKLHHVAFSNLDDALMLDRMKFLLEHGVLA